MDGFEGYDTGVATDRLPQPVHPDDDVTPAIADRLARVFPRSDDRWQVWRRVDPDAEYLRGGA